MKILLGLIYLLLAGLVLLALSSCQVEAQTAQATCFPHNQIVTVLQEQYGEQQTILGLTEGGLVMEIFSSPETGTWSALITHPDGTTCLASSGNNFEFAVTTVPGEDG